jgi:hypothetical protein
MEHGNATKEVTIAISTAQEVLPHVPLLVIERNANGNMLVSQNVKTLAPKRRKNDAKRHVVTNILTAVPPRRNVSVTNTHNLMAVLLAVTNAQNLVMELVDLNAIFKW